MIYADYIVDFAISAIDDYIAIIGDAPEADLSNYIELNVTYVSGKTENMALASASANGITIDWAENALTGTTSKVFGGNANIEAKKTINGQTVTRTATIVPENDYLVSFTVNYNRSVYVGGTVDAAGFTIATQTWASGSSTPVTEGVSSTLSVLVNGVTQFAIPSTVPANTNYPVEVTVVGQPQAGSVTQVVNVVANTAPVTPPSEEK